MNPHQETELSLDIAIARIAALETAILQVFRRFDEATVEAPGEVRDHAKVAYADAEEIIYELGLAHRLWANESDSFS